MTIGSNVSCRVTEDLPGFVFFLELSNQAAVFRIVEVSSAGPLSDSSSSVPFPQILQQVASSTA